MKAKIILENDKYPPQFYEPLVNEAMDRLIREGSSEKDEEVGTKWMKNP